MVLNKFNSIGLTELNKEELKDINGGIIPLLIASGIIWAGNAARIAVVATVIAAAGHVANDGYHAGHNSVH